MNDEWWSFQAVEGFWWRTHNICECRVAFATEKIRDWFVLSSFFQELLLPFQMFFLLYWWKYDIYVKHILCPSEISQNTLLSSQVRLHCLLESSEDEPKAQIWRSLSLLARTFCWSNIVSQLFYYFVNNTLSFWSINPSNNFNLQPD